MIKPDNIIMCSELPSYINIGDTTASLTLSGTIPNGSNAASSIHIPISNLSNRSDIYATNTNTDEKSLLSSTNFFPIYQSVSTETAGFYIQYSLGSILFTLFVDNFTGSTITLITQTFTIDIVQYQLPF